MIDNSASNASPYTVNVTVDDSDADVSDQVSTSFMWTVNEQVVQNDVWLEAECAIVGSNFGKVSDLNASGGIYLTSPSNSYSSAPSNDTANTVIFNFDVPVSGQYKIFARTIAPTTNDDSYWVRANGGSWERYNLIEASVTFNWDQVHNDLNNSQPVLFNLTAGSNTVEFAARENGTSLDKIYITIDGR